MRARITWIVLLLLGSNAVFAEARTINDIPEARESLRRTVNRKLYRSLVISPIDGWIVVRGQLAKDHVVGAKLIRSELSGRYDAMALELANNLRILNYTQDNPGSEYPAVLVHLLIYRIANGRMALSFAHLAESGGGQLAYSGAAWMAVQKANQWVTVEPKHLARGERHGPRSYTLAVESPGSLRQFGNGRLPMTGITIQGSQESPFHKTGSR